MQIPWLFKENRAKWMCIVHSWAKETAFLPWVTQGFGVALENSMDLFPRASEIQPFWDSAGLHLLPLKYGRAAVIHLCNICSCSPQFLIFHGKLSNKSEIRHVNNYPIYLFFFTFSFPPYLGGLQTQFVWKIISCFNDMLDKYLPVILPLII